MLEMDEEKKFSTLEIVMKANFWMEKLMETASSSSLMATSMKDNFRMVKCMENAS